MTYEEKKAWLWRYRSAKRFELLRLDEVATLEAEARRTTQRYSALPGGSGDGQTLPRCVERIDEARRAAEAHALAERMRGEYLASCVGKTLEVLFETEENGLSTGHASNYVEVSVPGTGLRGLVKNVQISGVSGEMLVGAAI